LFITLQTCQELMLFKDQSTNARVWMVNSVVFQMVNWFRVIIPSFHHSQGLQPLKPKSDHNPNPNGCWPRPGESWEWQPGTGETLVSYLPLMSHLERISTAL